jgi:hypothetical protein
VLGEDGGIPGLVGGAFDAVLLGLLVHADSREWVARTPVPSSPTGPEISPGAAVVLHDHRRRHAQATEELP